jgi:acetoin utilization deacetylase AcuC-like enzyme
MNRTGLAYHPDCLKHALLPGKPETPDRVSGTLDHLRQTGLIDRLRQLTPDPPSEEDLLRVHDPRLIEYVRDLSENGYQENSVINGDIYVGPDTYKAALLAAGGAVCAAEASWNGDLDNAFAMVRPPGHHAGRMIPAGFCFFNNTAVAIRRLQEVHGLEKAAVFDWDAHCGHGTMGIFYEDPTVLTISVHRDPHNFYPGTGFVEQVGEEDGKGYCMNVPVPEGTGDPDYIRIIDGFMAAKLRKFDPDIIFVAAGQDSHMNEGIGGLMLTDDGYAAMTGRLMALAEELCGGRLVLTLEGGYNTPTLPVTHHRILSTLLGEAEAPEIAGEPMDSTTEILETLEQKLTFTPMRA